MTRSSLVRLDDDFAARIRPGSGDGVLWIHPYTLDSSAWSELWEQLPAFHHIGIDLPGHGVSMPPGPKDDLPLLARRIGELAIERGARHLVGLSFGSLVALQVAIEHPRAFASMLLAAPAIGGGPQEEAIAIRFRRVRRSRVVMCRGRGDRGWARFRARRVREDPARLRARPDRT